MIQQGITDKLARTGTHGFLGLSSCQIHRDSNDANWDSVFMSYQTERPFDFVARPNSECLLVAHLTGPTRVRTRFDGKLRDEVMPLGAVTFWPPEHDIQVQTEKTLKTIHVYVDSNTVRDVFAQYGRNNFSLDMLAPIFGEADELLNRLMVELWHSSEMGGQDTNLYSTQLSQMIAARLLQRQGTTKQRGSQNNGSALTKPKLNLIADYVQANIDKRTTIDELATLVNLSPSHFTRSFKRETDKSPYQFVIETRINSAKNLLQFSELPIVEIALECGFSDQEHFSNSFRRHVGTTPLKYRKEVGG